MPRGRRTARSDDRASGRPRPGPGRSYHADRGANNQRLRVHYLLEAGWKADAAIQGLGRSNRTNQAQPPLFRPIATDVKAEKRFPSTIARRLDTLGAITRGQRQTGGQGLFRADDNLESPYARAALRQFYLLLYAGKVDGCPRQEFEEATGLNLTDRDGSLREDLPPITTFLNRLLALTIELQNTLFGIFESLLQSKVEAAIAAGIYDAGVETLTAESLRVTTRRTIYTHKETGAETRVFTIARRDRNRPITLDDNEQAQRRSQAEQNGSEVKSVELEALIARGQSLIERRNVFEFLRDDAAELFEVATGSAWRPRSGSLLNHRALTASMIDSRDFIAARRRAKSELLLPGGTRIAFTGGIECNDHQRIWAALDKVRTKYSDMVLLHGGAPRGAERIAVCWADSRKVAQIVFKPDWTRHRKAAPFKRNDQMLETLPAGVIAFPGSGISANLADKARKFSIPV